MSHRTDASVADPRPPVAQNHASTPASRVAFHPLRMQVMSDLHFDTGPGPMPHAIPGVDAVVVAGDTCSGAEKCFAYLRAAFPAPLPLVVVLGNREFHGRALVPETRRARALAADYGVTLLDDRSAVLGGVRFVGGTLWTDYRLHGEDRQAAAIAGDVRRGDYARIALVDRPYRTLTPLDAVARHEATSALIARTLAEPFDGPTVVVTHHAPSARSLDPRMAGGVRDASYASRLDRTIVGGAPTVWIHGHVHHSCDYGLCRTRVVCNPKGPGNANPAFDPSLVIEVSR
jgi:hypothetical protein